MSQEISLFTAAGLPGVDTLTFKKALQRTQQSQASRLGGLPFLRMGKDGLWVYGAENTEVEEGSLWAINIWSMQVGFIAWGAQGTREEGTVLGEQLASIAAAEPVLMQNLPDVGVPWSECNAFDLLCISGEDKGTTVKFKTNSVGGKRAFNDLLKVVYAALDDGSGKVVPIVELDSDNYQHPKYGKIYTPVFTIKKWVMPDDKELGGAGAPPAAASAEKAPPKEEKSAAPAQQQADGAVRRRRSRS